MPKARTPRKTKTSEKPAPGRGRSRPPAASRPEGASLASTVFHEQIAARAYELFLARGGQHGDDLADWFQAEAAVLGTRARADESSGKTPDDPGVGAPSREAVEVSRGRNTDRGR